MKGVPDARAPFSDAWNPERSASWRSSVGHHQQHRGRRQSEPGDPAQGGRGGDFGEVHGDAGGDDDRWLVGLEAGRGQLLPPGPVRLEVERHEPQPVGDAVAELDQALALPGLGAGLIDLEHP